MTIRALTEIAEFEECVRLQREIWGMADIDLIPSRSYAVQTHIGGIVLGAFDSDRLIGFVNATIGLVIKILTLPLTLLTFGVFWLVINALMLLLASALVPGFIIHGFWSAFFGAIVLSIVSTILSSLLA